MAKMQNKPFLISDLFNLRSSSLYYSGNIGRKNYFIFRKRGQNNADVQFLIPKGRYSERSAQH